MAKRMPISAATSEAAIVSGLASNRPKKTTSLCYLLTPLAPLWPFAKVTLSTFFVERSFIWQPTRPAATGAHAHGTLTVRVIPREWYAEQQRNWHLLGASYSCSAADGVEQATST